ncbi:SGNH/GDSL hydrolase family protein [Clostridium felsineum]|uniref:SGNH/GDSL hydrolase family protein n=1 Tax=Clostridium felsineum TaxID=36839 RepID=UPI00098C9D26|nr:SGNH/GDSL hydrolase family protein [Clostridium felsineum]URZ18276.1 Cellulase/esterase CelE [Clostridium felsineum DSM 794]
MSEIRGWISNEIKYIGRFDFSEKKGPLFAWTGSEVRANFMSKKLSAKFESFGLNYLIIMVDGEIINNCLDISNGGEFILAENLSEGAHEIRLIKRNEFNVGTVRFLGFNFYGGQLLKSEHDPKLKVEIIGDSISCGFGNEGENEDEYEPIKDNGYMSYGAIAGRSLEAETIIIGCSGYGMIQNYLGDEKEAVPLKYNLITPKSRINWQFSKWVPDVVVINLGTNDFCYGDIPDLDKFISGYIEFIKVIHRNYKNSKIICAVGPLMEGKALEIIKSCIKDKIIKHFNKDYNLNFLEFPKHCPEKDGQGIGGHPSIETHNKMANILVQKVKSIMSL